jgi:hypothetical protein
MKLCLDAAIAKDATTHQSNATVPASFQGEAKHRIAV